MKKTKIITVLQRIRIEYDEPIGLQAAIKDLNAGILKPHLDVAANLLKRSFYNAKNYGTPQVVKSVSPRNIID